MHSQCVISHLFWCVFNFIVDWYVQWYISYSLVCNQRGYKIVDPPSILKSLGKAKMKLLELVMMAELFVLPRIASIISFYWVSKQIGNSTSRSSIFPTMRNHGWLIFNLVSFSIIFDQFESSNSKCLSCYGWHLMYYTLKSSQRL